MSEQRSPGRSSRAKLPVVLVLAVGLAWVVVALVNRSWFSAALALTFVVAAFIGARSQPLELAFNVGPDEVHRVGFRFDNFWGNLSITVDGRPVVEDLRLFTVKLISTYRFSIGAEELHEVGIEKDRHALLAGARPQPVRAYVDDVLTAEGVA